MAPGKWVLILFFILTSQVIVDTKKYQPVHEKNNIRVKVQNFKNPEL